MLNVLLGTVLTLLGFSSCRGGNDEGVFPWEVLYGSPYANFDVRGAVLNEAGDRLEGMTVTAKEVFEPESENGCPWSYEVARTKTDASGQYLQHGTWTGGEIREDVGLRIVVEDPRGEYAADSVDVRLTHTDKGNEKTWCYGTDVGVADFRLVRTKDKE